MQDYEGMSVSTEEGSLGVYIVWKKLHLFLNLNLATYASYSTQVTAVASGKANKQADRS